MVSQFAPKLLVPNFPEESRQVLSHAIDLAKASQKFMLPDGGRLLDDYEYRALDESQPLRLPFPFIALEYHRAGPVDERTQGKSSKAIVFARERDDAIVLTNIAWIDSHGIWGPLPEVAIPRVHYLDRKRISFGRVAICAQSADERIDISESADEIGALLCFLNALQCSNVSATHTITSAKNPAMAKALGFDSYRVLTIGKGEPSTGRAALQIFHRSPREHLRRGHIRRLQSGSKTWVNATVVSANKGAGVVSKDYRLR